MIHILKIWPEFFEAIINGVKRFEIRKIDDCKVGDLLSLYEYCPESEDFTGRVTNLLEVVYISEFEQKSGYKVLGFVMDIDKLARIENRMKRTKDKTAKRKALKIDEMVAKQRKIDEIMAKYKTKRDGGLPWFLDLALIAQREAEIAAERTGEVIGIVKGDVDNAKIVAALKRGGIEVVDEHL